MRPLTMFKNLDLVCGGLAWLCGLFFAIIPIAIQLGILSYLHFAWLVCIGALLLLRRRPWRQLWWVWPSGLLLWRYWALLVLLFLGLVFLTGLIGSGRWKSFSIRNNLDLVFGALAWLCGLGVLFALDLPLPGGSWVYQTTYFPISWAACVAGLLFFRRRPWPDLWWVWPSLPVVLLAWAILFWAFLCMGGLK